MKLLSVLALVLAMAVGGEAFLAPSRPMRFLAMKPLSAGPSAAEVKDLRVASGAGMMKCKEALVECEGDFEKAAEWLRAKGLASADKKSDRATSEGLVATYVHTGSKLGVMVEVNCETDFVVSMYGCWFVWCLFVSSSSVPAKLSVEWGLVIICVPRPHFIQMHARFETSWSLLFVWCAQSKGEKFAELCRAVAMQVAASPTVDFVKSSDISDAVKEQERRLEMQAEDLAGKPDDIKAKMVEGRLGKILKTKVVVKPRIKKTAEKSILRGHVFLD